MKLFIIFSIILILCFVYVLVFDIKEGFGSNRNLGEGTLSFHKRMFVKHIHRPMKFKSRQIYKNLMDKYRQFKRSYL